MRNGRWVVTVVLVGVIAVVGAACGGDDGDGGDGSSSETRSAAPTETSGFDADLDIRMTGMDAPVPAAAKCTKRRPATCDLRIACPAADDADQVLVDACELLEESHTTLLAAPAEHEVCTQQYGGPETAHVTGVVEGEDVDVDVDRTNGCGIARWQELARLWGDVPRGQAVETGSSDTSE